MVLSTPDVGFQRTSDVVPLVPRHVICCPHTCSAESPMLFCPHRLILPKPANHVLRTSLWSVLGRWSAVIWTREPTAPVPGSDTHGPESDYQRSEEPCRNKSGLEQDGSCSKDSQSGDAGAMASPKATMVNSCGPRRAEHPYLSNWAHLVFKHTKMCGAEWTS